MFIVFGLPGSITRQSTVNYTQNSRDTEETGKTTLGLSLGTTWEGGEPTQPPSPTLASLTSGPYAAKYGTLDQLGQVGGTLNLKFLIFSQGAFGSVRLAYKLDDRELVVTKFIIVAKVSFANWLSRFYFLMMEPRWLRVGGLKVKGEKELHSRLLCSQV